MFIFQCCLQKEDVTESVKQSGTVRQEKALLKTVLGSCAVSMFVSKRLDPDEKLQAFEVGNRSNEVH
jgi:hypothetical protein